MRIMTNFMKAISWSGCSESAPQRGDFRRFTALHKLYLNPYAIQGCSTSCLMEKSGENFDKILLPPWRLNKVQKKKSQVQLAKMYQIYLNVRNYKQ